MDILKSRRDEIDVKVSTSDRVVQMSLTLALAAAVCNADDHKI